MYLKRTSLRDGALPGEGESASVREKSVREKLSSEELKLGDLQSIVQRSEICPNWKISWRDFSNYFLSSLC